jgi:hypothetical protein
MTVRAMNKKTVQATLKQLKAAGYKVEGKKGWYKAFDGDTQVFSAMPASKGPSIVTLNADYFG